MEAKTLALRTPVPFGLTALVLVLVIAPVASALPLIGVPVNLVTTAPFPEGLAVSPDGNLYVSRVSFGASSSILVLSPRGQVLGEIAISAGPGGLADLVGEAFDEAGNLYVADFADALASGSCACNGRVLKISPEGDIATVLSGLAFPNALAFDTSGNLYVSDSIAGRIWLVAPDGSASEFLANDLLVAHNPGTNPPVGVNGIAFTRDGMALLAANTIDGTIVTIPINADGSAGTPSVLASGLVGADGLALDVKGNIYVAVNFGNQIVVVGPDGSLRATYVGTGDNVLRNPASLAFLGRSLFITDLAAFIPGSTPGVSVLTARYPGAPLLE